MKKFVTALFAVIAIVGVSQTFACDPDRLPDCTVYPDQMVCEIR